MAHEADATPTALLVPAEGVPPVTDSAEGIAAAAKRLAAGSGPLAVDAERASGFRYSNRAYLIQLRRAGAGTVLIDPIPIAPDLGRLAEVINPLEWVLHAADQDLPGLAELGLRPEALYDTELAGRLAGFERVGLAAIVERTLGFELRKGHGAADWSRRPLPHDWLNYAALDVEVLLALREAMATELASQGKTEWAAEEFEYVRTRAPSPPRPDRWRRTSQIHTLRKPRQLATVRELWTARDRLATTRDVAPGRVLPDAAIIAAANADPVTVEQLRALPVFGGPRQRRSSQIWLSAIERARSLPDDALPPVTQPFDGPPPANRWSRKDPVAYARLSAVRAALARVSKSVSVPTENLLSPDLLRRLCWDGLAFDTADPASPRLTEDVERFLRENGAREWQRSLVVEPLAAALGRASESDGETQGAPD